MPIYEYECRECGHVFDALQKMSDAPLTDCPDCGKPSLRKLVSAPNFRLKGGGWYETDFKDRNQRNLAGEGSKSNGTTTDTPKSDAKTDAGARSDTKSSGAADKGGSSAAAASASD